MNPEAIATLILAIVATGGITAAAFGWFFKRGGSEREITIALQAQATATQDNTVATRDLSTAFQGFKDEVLTEVRNFDVRITRLEANKANGSAPANRDAGSPRGRSAW